MQRGVPFSLQHSFTQSGFAGHAYNRLLPISFFVFDLQDVLTIDICQFSSWDLDNDNSVTDTEIDVLIEMTGLLYLDQLFEELDTNKGNSFSIERFFGHLLAVFYVVYS